MENTYLYFTAVIFAVALASLILYDPSDAKGYRFALGMILTAALFTPAVPLVNGLKNIDFAYTGEGFESISLEKTLEKAVADGVRDSIAEEFSIKKNSIEVELFGFDAEKITAEGITVTLIGTAAAKDIVAVEKFVSELGLGECILEVRVG